jgi:hypothetical protein
LRCWQGGFCKEYQALKISALLFVGLLTCATASQVDMAAGQSKHKLLRDGAILAGVDGTLSKAQNADTWYFTFKTTVADEKGNMAEGEAIEVLRSSTLEKMQSVMTDSKADFRLWGRVTQFEGKNFVFPVYFLTVMERQQSDVSVPADHNAISLNEPNDVVKIPQEVLEKLTPKRTVELTQLSPTAGLEEDRMFSDRSGFINKAADGSFVFKPDALGRKLDKISFAVLLNDVLQQAMDEQSHELDHVRFKVTGILTTYNGQNYILLQRAARQYNHGNFAR